jgi:hypothetical protein
MTDHRNWHNGSAFPTGDGAPEDATWTFGVATAGPPDIVSDAILNAPVTAAVSHPVDASADGAGQPPAGGADQEPAGGAGQQIVFIEGSVADYQILADGVQPGVTVVILNPDANGVQQIADYLQQHDVQNLAAISIVADGADGELQLGSTLLSASNVATYQPQLAAIGTALAPGGDLLLYGCDVAQNSAGDAFLGDLAGSTGVANVAAASHVVGAAADGGSFNLDVDLGTAATATGPFTAATTAAYPDLLGIAVQYPDACHHVPVTDAGGYRPDRDAVALRRGQRRQLPDGVGIDHLQCQPNRQRSYRGRQRYHPNHRLVGE